MSATLGDVRKGFKNTLMDALPGIFVYDTIQGVTQVPAIVVEPDVADLIKPAPGTDQDWKFNLYVLVAFAQPDQRQDQLDAMLSGVGDKSITKLLQADPSLGVNEGVRAVAAQIGGYGGQWKTLQIPHIGAWIRVHVYIDNSS